MQRLHKVTCCFVLHSVSMINGLKTQNFLTTNEVVFFVKWLCRVLKHKRKTNCFYNSLESTMRDYLSCSVEDPVFTEIRSLSISPSEWFYVLCLYINAVDQRSSGTRHRKCSLDDAHNTFPKANSDQICHYCCWMHTCVRWHALVNFGKEENSTRQRIGSITCLVFFILINPFGCH